ncbi:MAG: molybdopterin dinucleotide binding domain-containing protein, partial [Granulosicoccus sp.]
HCSTVQRFWRSPAIADKPGLTAVELFDAVAKGEIKALWIMATNPVDSMPNADQVERAIATCPFVVVSDVTSASDTVDKAHIALPAQPFGEKDGTVSNSERRVSRMRRFCKAQGESRPDWWAICEVARRMGHEDAFRYASAAEIFREYATLSGFENAGSRDFDISAYATLTDDQYDAMQPFQWPKPEGAALSPPAEGTASALKPVRFFARGRFYTPDGKANMLAAGAGVIPRSQSLPESEQTLNTGRIRDQWHTMTRTGYSSRLMSHYAEPFVELNPGLAERQGISTGDIVKVGSARGHVLLRASVSDRQRPSDVFVPMHWNRKFASRARIDAVVDDRVDPFSRQPAFKNQLVSVTRFPANSYAYVLSHARFDVANCHGIEYWATAPVSGGWQMELAGSASPKVMLDTVVSHLMLEQAAERSSLRSVEYSNAQGHDHRIAFFINEQLAATVFVTREPVALSRSWAALLFNETDGSLTSRWRLLAGRPGNDVPEKGAIVCSCMMVGASEIQTAIVDRRCETVDAVGCCTGAGTQCGSCRNELLRMIKHSQSEALKAELA